MLANDSDHAAGRGLSIPLDIFPLACIRLCTPGTGVIVMGWKSPVRDWESQGDHDTK